MTKKATRTRAEAKRLMWEYYRDNKAHLPRSIRIQRELILELIIDGAPVTVAFEETTKT